MVCSDINRARSVNRTSFSFTTQTKSGPHCQMHVHTRRQGYAKILLKACEELARGEGSRHLSLHARLSDEPAQQLYIASFGYGAVARDSFLAKLRGVTPRALLRKRIQ